jgi:CheY-like chemotaxis protein
MPLSGILSCCLNEFPTGIIIISSTSQDNNKSGRNMHQLIYSNNFAKRVFRIKQNLKESEMISEFKKEVEKYHKREFDKLTNVSLYDVLFGDEEIKDSGDSFFSETNMIFVKKKYCLNYILLSIDNLKSERDDIRQKLLKSISYQHLNTLHHELNNPLNSLINTVEQINTHLYERIQLSVFLIKTGIKKFILYNKNICDNVLFDNTGLNIYNMQYIFTKVAKKFLIAYRYKRVKFHIEHEFAFINNFSIRNEPYYLKEFLRNIFLYIYYLIPKNSILTISYDFLENNSLLSMSFQLGTSPYESHNPIQRVYSDKTIVDIRGEDVFLDNNNTIKSIEITKEILVKIARVLNCSISFPEEGEKVLVVVEFSNVYKNEELLGEYEDNINEFMQTVSEFDENNKNISELPTFNETTTFSYLDVNIKGIGKDSLKINSNYKSLLNNYSVNSYSGNSLQDTRPITHKSTEGNSGFIRNASFDQRKLNESCQHNSKDKNKQLKSILKRDDSFKRHPTLQSVVKICEKMKDPIIDNLKNTIVNAYFHEGSSLGNAWGSTNNTNGHCKHLLLPSGEFIYNYEKNKSFKLVSKSSYAIRSGNFKINAQKKRTFFASNKGLVNIPNLTDFDSFKTKEFPTKGVIQITPLIRNELCLLNTSFSKDNSIYKYSDSELDNGPEIIEASVLSPNISPRISSITFDKFGLTKPDILLVDDEEFNLMTLQSLLKLERLLAETATNGEEAVLKVELNPNYKLIFMDVYMPVMDGIQACKAIEKKYQNGELNQKLAVVIVSAHSKETVMSQIDNLTVVKKFVQKPLAKKKLKEILQDYYY